jgi:hypothetical protein
MPGTTEDRERVNEACRKLNTYVPSDLSLYFWPLPLIEKLIERIEALEREVAKR